LNSIDCEVVATWNTGDSLLAGGAAITRRQAGGGAVYYVGGYAQADAVGVLAGWVLRKIGVGPVVEASENVEAIARGPYVVLMNHGAVEQVVSGVDGTNALDGTIVSGGRVTLTPYGIALIQRKSFVKKSGSSLSAPSPA
jgi:hypothetical protein